MVAIIVAYTIVSPKTRPFPFPISQTIMSDENTVFQELSYPILLSDRLTKIGKTSFSFNSDCTLVAMKTEAISHLLRSIVRLSASPSIAALIYRRPIHRVAAGVTRSLDSAFYLIKKCRRRNFFCRLLDYVTTADFPRVFSLLDNSVADLKWVINVLRAASGGAGGEIVISLPPIASTDPTLAWVWTYMATIQMSKVLSKKVEAASLLGSLAANNDRNRRVIVEEGGVAPLVKFLKEVMLSMTSSMTSEEEIEGEEAKLAAVFVLYNVADVEERARAIVDSSGVGVIVNVLRNSCMKVQIKVCNLVVRMIELGDFAKEAFVRENVIRPLVSLLSFETFDDDYDRFDSKKFYSIPSLVRINKETGGDNKERKKGSFSSFSDGGSSRGGRWQSRKDREMESVEVKKELKIVCSRALWVLARGSVPNCQRITETKGLLCLAKLIEKEDGELRFNSLMTIKEITSAAELDLDLRRSAFNKTSPAAMAVVEQLLIVITESDDPTLQILAIISIGSISRTFPARFTHVIKALVEQLGSNNRDVRHEATIALGKFVCSDNHLHKEHAKTIAEFNPFIPLLRLLRENDRPKVHGLILLCNLAIHASDCETLQQPWIFGALEGADRDHRALSALHPQLKDLITQAIYHLCLYREDTDPFEHIL